MTTIRSFRNAVVLCIIVAYPASGGQPTTASFPTDWAEGGMASIIQGVALWGNAEVCLTVNLPPCTVTSIQIPLVTTDGECEFPPGETDGYLQAHIYATTWPFTPTGSSIADSPIIAYSQLPMVPFPYDPIICSAYASTFTFGSVKLEAGTYAFSIGYSRGGDPQEWCRPYWPDPIGSGTDGYTKYRTPIGSGSWSVFSGWDLSFNLAYIRDTGPAVNPTPADGSGPGVDFTDLTFSWENPCLPDDYNVYVGPGAESLTLVAEEVGAWANYVTSLMELATIWGQDPIDSIIYWRVDSRFGASVVTGDVWSFDPRPEEAGTSNVFGTSPTPLPKADIASQMIMITEDDD